MRAGLLFRGMSLLAVPLFLLCGPRAWTQMNERPHATPERIAAELKQIETASAKATGDQLGIRWALLGFDYQDVGDVQRAEEAYGRALKLLGGSSSAPRSYAIALDGLASLYIETGRAAESETCLRKAIAVLERIGDQTTASIFYGRLGQSLLGQHKYKAAEPEFSMAVKGVEGAESVHPRVLVSFILGQAYSKCFQHRCAEGLADAKRGMEIVGRVLPSDSIEAVMAWMTLGYMLWKTGDFAGGGESMRVGLRVLSEKKDMTPATHALTRSGALSEYAQYLKATHRKAEAKQVEREIASLRSVQERSCNGCTVNVVGLSNALR